MSLARRFNAGDGMPPQHRVALATPEPEAEGLLSPSTVADATPISLPPTLPALKRRAKVKRRLRGADAAGVGFVVKLSAASPPPQA